MNRPSMAAAERVGALVPGLCSCRCRLLTVAVREVYRLNGEWTVEAILHDLVDEELVVVRRMWPSDVPRQLYGPFNGAVHVCLPRRSEGGAQ